MVNLPEQSYNFDNSTKIWYWGSKFTDESEWNYKPNGGIVEITICYSDNEVIYALSFKNVDKNGNAECSRKFGGDGGNKEKVIKLDWPREYLTSISWTCETFRGFYVIQSLCFETNKNKYGPFGPTTGIFGKFSMDGVVIVGFHGYHGIYLDGLGCYVKSSIDLFGPSRPRQVVTAKIKMDESGEYISGVMGFYGPIDENASYAYDVLRSLSFYSNKGKYGPFGKEIGIFFSSPIYNGKVVGFHGKSGDYLEAIGVHMELI
ncbi:hypothetical protein EZV62_021396 [Acer yangbiense]|uniref:Jacalin-type lectin domain-containing protein n=1 Tax=Acer yangbiense TaxID=1000413 RepID=A0A5C7H5L8_9ROSI|nr:hypothetical protein EZV62_021396 [Acer yangbiense]